MKLILSLSIRDFKSTFRDPLFKGLLFFPFIAFVMIRWIFPLVAAQYPAVVPYAQVILMWACIQSATMFGFIYGFLLLEEKEENISQMLRIVPVSGLKLLLSRLLIGLFISSVVNICLIHYGRIVQLSMIKELFLSVLFSLSAPLIALGLGAFAKNRIEGLAQMKIINLLLIMPALIYFIPHQAMHFTAVIPTYWSYRSMEFADDITSFIVHLVIGYILHGICIWLLNQKFDTQRQ